MKACRNIERLPRWAQLLLDRQEHQIKSLQRALKEREELRESPFKQRAQCDKLHRFVNLPEQHCVRVCLNPENPDRQWLEVRVSDKLDEPTVYLIADRGLRIQPQTYNTVHIIIED